MAKHVLSLEAPDTMNDCILRFTERMIFPWIPFVMHVSTGSFVFRCAAAMFNILLTIHLMYICTYIHIYSDCQARFGI